MTICVIAVVRRIDVAFVIVVEGQAGRVVTARRSRPIEAVVADKAEAPIIEATITRSRIPDGGSTAEHTGEVHAFV